MDSQKWLTGIRLFAGCLLAPAIVPAVLAGSLRIITHQGPPIDDFTRSALTMFVLTVGLGLAYLLALCFCLPCVLSMRRAGWLNFRTVLGPALVLAWLYALLVYACLQNDYPFAKPVAALSALGVVLACLFFYVIAVWRTEQRDTEPDLLLESYLAPRKDTAEPLSTPEPSHDQDLPADAPSYGAAGQSAAG